MKLGFKFGVFKHLIMEEVESANKAAVESCHRILNLLAQPQDHHVQSKKLTVQTGEAIVRFKKVVSLLENNLGHPRVRISKKVQNLIPQNILLDNPAFLEPPKTLQFQELSSNGVNLNSIGKTPIQIGIPQNTPNPSSGYQFFQQQHQQQQAQLQLKQQAEMLYRRSNSGINLNFDNAGCTPTISNRSFMSSLSIEGSVTTLNGSSFQLTGSTRSTDHQHKPRCSGRGDDGSVKCGSSGRCHCKKRLDT